MRDQTTEREDRKLMTTLHFVCGHNFITEKNHLKKSVPEIGKNPMKI